jgi:hypothetical protein
VVDGEDKVQPAPLYQPEPGEYCRENMLQSTSHMGAIVLFTASLSLVLSSCCSGVTPGDLLWRTRSEYQTVYPVNVRGDSIVIGDGNYNRFLLLNPTTGAIADTFDALENASTEILLIRRLGFDGREYKNRIVIPVEDNFYLDSLVLIMEDPKMRGDRISKTLLMRRREDRQWATVKIDVCQFSPNDYVPYKDRYLLLQYTLRPDRGEYRYEVGLLDLSQAVRWRK